MGVRTLVLLAAIIQTVCCWYGADAAPAVSGDLVIKKDYSGPKFSQRTKLYVISPRGVNRGSIVLPYIQKQQYSRLAVSGKYVFLTSVPDGYQPDIVGLKLVVVDLSRNQPKVKAQFAVPTGNLAGANEKCGGTSRGRFGYFGAGAVTARRATGTGKGSYRVAVSVACFDTTEQRCLIRSVMQVFTFSPATRTLKRMPPAYTLATGFTDVGGFCSVKGAPAIEDAKWFGDSIVFVSSNSVIDRKRSLYKLAAGKPAALLATYNGFGQNSEFCDSFIVASPTSAYAICYPDFSIQAKQITEKFKNNRARPVGQTLDVSQLSLTTLATTGEASTPIYIGAVNSTTRQGFKFLSIGKASRGPVQKAFASRYNFDFPDFQVVD